MNYTFEEQADIHLFYGRAWGNAAEAKRLYEEAFPNRRVPCERFFVSVDRSLRERGKFYSDKENSGPDRYVRTPETEEAILNAVNANPQISTRRLALQEGVSASSVWRVLHEQLLYPYHMQRVQALKPQDLPRREAFCRWLVLKCERNAEFIQKILFTDEAGFTRDGVVNFHNNHIWAEENPHAFFESRHQEKFSINVWAGILGNRLLGPFVLPNRLDGLNYLDFLRNNLIDLLEDVPYETRRTMWFMHDGAPPHFRIVVRSYLNAAYPNRWIGRNGPVAWPPDPRSKSS